METITNSGDESEGNSSREGDISQKKVKNSPSCRSMYHINSQDYHYSSSDSNSSIFPWKHVDSRQSSVLKIETGRGIKPSVFYLCVYAVLLLCCGIIMCGISLWTMLHKLSYSYFISETTIFDAGTFSLFGGLLSVPCCWIAWTLHGNIRNYQLLPLIILLLLFSLSMLSTGATIGIVTRSKIAFQTNIRPPKLSTNSYKMALNESMTRALINTEQYLNKHSWDKLQSQLKCCGIIDSHDWKKYNKEIPKSCYNINDQVYQFGCIDGIGYEYAWQTCLNTGFSLILFTIQFTAMIFISGLYIIEKFYKSPQEKKVYTVDY